VKNENRIASPHLFSSRRLHAPDPHIFFQAAGCTHRILARQDSCLGNGWKPLI
jgi:hypothetical protein